MYFCVLAIMADIHSLLSIFRREPVDGRRGRRSWVTIVIVGITTVIESTLEAPVQS